MSSLFQRFLESDTGHRLLNFAIKHHKRFLVLLICLLMGYVCLSLFSYNQADPAWSHLPADNTATVTNLGGMGGAWLADVLYLFFGKMAWAILLWLAMEAYFVVLPNRYLFPLRFVSYGLLWVSLCLLAVGIASLFSLDPFVLAGVVGASIFKALSALLTTAGAYAFALICLLGFGYLMVSPLYQGRGYFLDFLPKSSKKANKPKTNTTPSPVSKVITEAVHQDLISPAKTHDYDGVLNNFLVNSGLQDELNTALDDEPIAGTKQATSVFQKPVTPVQPPVQEPLRQEPPNPILAKPKPTFVVRSEPTKVEPTKVEPTKVEPTKVEPTKVEPTKVEPNELPVRIDRVINDNPKPVASDIPAPTPAVAQTTSEPMSVSSKLVYEYEATQGKQDYQTPATASKPIKINASDTGKDGIFGGIRLGGVIAHSNVPLPPAYPNRIQLGQVKPPPAITPVPKMEIVHTPAPVEPKPNQSTQNKDNQPTISEQQAIFESVQPIQSVEVIEPVPAQPVPAQPVPAQPVPAQPVPAQPVPVASSVVHQSSAITTANKMANLPRLPPLSLLDERPIHGDSYSESELVQLSELLEIKLKEFGVVAEVMSISQGPVITSFEVALAAGIKASKVTGISQDLARSLSVTSVRVVEVIAGKPYIGIEIPNRTRQTIRLIELLDTPEYQHSKGVITSAVGKSSVGEVIMTDIYTAPHMLIAGATRSGKSVLVNSMLLSMLLKYTPEELRFVMIDPKLLELTIYDDIPHLLTPVITDMNDSISALSWCVGEMNRRYHIMNSIKVRQISDFNKKVKEAINRGEPLIDKTWQPNDSVSQDTPPILKPMPYIVVVVDEYADLVSQVKQVEELIDALARKSRAAGIHIILATQRPSVDVITGVIKANIPARIALSVRQKVDSRTILDTAGAETLLGWGDMLFIGNGSNDPIRVHGAYVSDDEVDRVCQAWRERGIPEYVEMEAPRDFSDMGADTSGQDELFGEAVAFVLTDGKTSISALQRHLSIGYNRAAKLIDAMEAQGILSPPDHTNKRTILKKP